MNTLKMASCQKISTEKPPLTHAQGIKASLIYAKQALASNVASGNQKKIDIPTYSIYLGCF